MEMGYVIGILVENFRVGGGNFVFLASLKIVGGSAKAGKGIFPSSCSCLLLFGY